VPLSLTAAKQSILLLYARIFAVDNKFSVGIKIVAVLNILWMIAAMLGLILQCRPVQKAWDPLLPGKCFSYAKFMVAIEVPNSLLDFVMMALPISMLRTLRIGMREKIILVLIFAMGAG